MNKFALTVVTMSEMFFEIQDMPGEIFDIDYLDQRDITSPSLVSDIKECLNELTQIVPMTADYWWSMLHDDEDDPLPLNWNAETLEAMRQDLKEAVTV